MRFTEQHKIDRPGDADWFDLNVEMDSPLYVDPFLIFDDSDPFWSAGHDEIHDFFDAALDLLTKAGGNQESMHWKKAEYFLQFPEPKEFALGLAMGHPEGAGIGPELAHMMCEELEFFRERGRGSADPLLAMIAVIVPGLGVDRISDMVCNVLKARFIGYTQEVCRTLAVAMKPVPVRNVSWATQGYRWRSERVDLPESPVFAGGTLLVPQRFLKDIPRVTADGFWSWAETNENERLRFDLNYDLAESLDKREKARRGRELAHRAVDLLETYVEEATAKGTPYDVDADPRGLVRWEEAGRAIALASAAPDPPSSQEEFEGWLIALAKGFKGAVEDNGLWRALWNDEVKRHRPEAIAQVIARSTWIEHCRSSGIDITREADCGRGPVDFKFTRGWEMRGLIEVKHISSTQFAHGAKTQLPIYLKGEQAPFGVYLCIGYQDQDFVEDRLGLVTSACEAISTQGETRIVPIFVDARPKPSASNAKPMTRMAVVPTG